MRRFWFGVFFLLIFTFHPSVSAEVVVVHPCTLTCMPVRLVQTRVNYANGNFGTDLLDLVPFPTPIGLERSNLRWEQMRCPQGTECLMIPRETPAIGSPCTQGDINSRRTYIGLCLRQNAAVRTDADETQRE